MDRVNHERMEHMLGGPVSGHLVNSFNRLENQAAVASAETHPSGWILALCNELAFLSGRVGELEKGTDQDTPSPSEESNLEELMVSIKGDIYRAAFMGMTEKGYYRVRLVGEDKIRVVAPDKVTTDA